MTNSRSSFRFSNKLGRISDLSILPSFLPVPAYVLELVCNSMSILPERGHLNAYTGINSNSMRSVVCAALRRGGSRLGSAGDRPAADDASKANEERRIQARSALNKQYSLVCLDRLREPWQQRKVQHCVRKEKEKEKEKEKTTCIRRSRTAAR